MRVTVCEMDDDRKEFEANWEGLREHVKRAKTDILLLPEMPFFGWYFVEPEFDQVTWDEAVESHKRWEARIPELGAKTVIWTAPIDYAGARVNRGRVWSEKGKIQAIHSKSYIPDEEGFYEDRWYQGGDRVFEPFESGGVTFGFLVCSEMWAMSRAREYGKRGVDLLLVPRSTSKGSVDKWLAGGRTASVISGAFSASSNRSGKRGELEFGGMGWVTGPDGEVLGVTTPENRFITVDVDQELAAKAKKSYPRNSLEPD